MARSTRRRSSSARWAAATSATSSHANGQFCFGEYCLFELIHLIFRADNNSIVSSDACKSKGAYLWPVTTPLTFHNINNNTAIRSRCCGVRGQVQGRRLRVRRRRLQLHRTAGRLESHARFSLTHDSLSLSLALLNRRLAGWLKPQTYRSQVCPTIKCSYKMDPVKWYAPEPLPLSSIRIIIENSVSVCIPPPCELTADKVAVSRLVFVA
jgi:hypothetical protein